MNINALAVAIAEALISVFSLTTYQLISWVADGLIAVFTLTASELLSALIHVLTELSESLSNRDLAQILKNRLFTSSQISEALKTVLGLSATAVASILETLGYLVSTIAGVLRTIFSKTANQVADTLEGLGFASTIASAVKIAFSLSATGVALVVKHIGEGFWAIVDLSL